MINENRPPYEVLGLTGEEEGAIFNGRDSLQAYQRGRDYHPTVIDALYFLQEALKPTEQAIYGRPKTLDEHHGGLFEEANELDDAYLQYKDVPTPENREALKKELVDVVFQLATYGGFLGINWVQEIGAKLDIVHEKYSQEDMDRLRKRGLPVETTVFLRKQEWIEAHGDW